MSEFIFLSTWRTSRGGLGASMRLMKKEVLLKSLENRKYWSQLRFAEIDETGEGESGLLNSMSVEQFGRCFSETDLTESEVDKYFNVEVRKVYGGKKVKPSYIKAKDLEVGCTYKTDGGYKFVWLGEVVITNGDDIKRGFLKSPPYNFTTYSRETYSVVNRDIKDVMNYITRYPELTKTPSKFVEKVESQKFEIPALHEDVLKITTQNYHRYGKPETKEFKVKIEFLDVK